VEPAYELFDHTADMGLRIRAVSLEALLVPATSALYAAIGTLVPGETAGARRIEVKDDEAAYLLRDFLTELLVMFERESRMVTTIDSAEFRDGFLAAECRLSTVDVPRSVLQREVKAITYHELAIKSTSGGFEATVIVDI